MKEKLKFQLIVSAILIIVGCGLLIAGFCVVPVGQIHNSVLVAFGEILTFVGAIMGMNYSFKSKISNNQTNKDNETDK
ncbi:MAG: hypothetical protein E6767_18935 [Dysgonomonas sp.]|nr:hypothetical protein [Dysgonomonas sp.]